MNAAERFFVASRARDVDAAAAELSPEVVMLNPGSDEPVVGSSAVAAALLEVDAACDRFQHTHLLRDPSPGRGLYGLVFEATVGEAKLRGVDLIELDDQDRIARFEVTARPMSALIALGNRMREARQ